MKRKQGSVFSRDAELHCCSSVLGMPEYQWVQGGVSKPEEDECRAQVKLGSPVDPPAQLGAKLGQHGSKEEVLALLHITFWSPHCQPRLAGVYGLNGALAWHFLRQSQINRLSRVWDVSLLHPEANWWWVVACLSQLTPVAGCLWLREYETHLTSS